jgi:uncharacterized protein (TIGR03435 family)
MRYLSSKVVLVVAAIATAVMPLAPQASAQKPLAFEAASVRVNKSGNPRDIGLQYLPDGRFSARSVPIPLLVLEAYDTPRLYPSPEFQKLDVSLIERDVYDIEATAPKGAIPPGSSATVRNEKIREMLRSLLAERFKLVVHREMKEHPVYALVVARNGPLQTAATEECADRPSNFFDPGSCHSIADLVRFASRISGLDRPLLDKTGLTGLYNIRSVDWAAMIPGSGRPRPSRSTFNAMLDDLGLKLDAQTATVEMIVVEHVERPIEN